MIVAFAIAHYSMTAAFVVYDLCSSSEGTFFYSVKIRVQGLHKEMIDGGKFMTLDLLGTSGQFVTRLVVPFNEAIRNKEKAERAEATTVTFKVGRKRKLPDIGRIRVDHEMWSYKVFVDYIDIKDLSEDEIQRHFRATIRQDVTMLNPAEVDVSKYQKDQVFITSHPVNSPGGRQVTSAQLILPELTVFFLFAIVIVMWLSFWVPYQLGEDTKEEKTKNLVTNGVVAGVVGTAVALMLMVMFKFFLKLKRTMCGLSVTGRFVLMTVLLMIAICLTIATGIQAHEYRIVATTWAWALLIGSAVVLVVGVPLGAGIEFMSRKQGEQLAVDESTTAPAAGPSRA